MEPNPKSFPILSYVMSRINSLSLRPTSTTSDIPDLENPQTPPPKSHHIELVERLPHLAHPELLASMARAIADVSQSRSVLKSLGDRPDHEALDAARSRLAQIDDELALKLEQLSAAPPDGEDADERRRELTEAAAKERAACEAIIELDGMHEEYEKLLDDAERRLEKMYGASTGVTDDGGDGNVNCGDEVQMNEEVAAILTRGKIVDRVDLSDRSLRILPDAFGQMRALVSLNLSNNQLEAIPDAIGGLENLEELRLSSNLLVSLPDTIGLLTSLKILGVSANRLKSLPDSISKCRSLVELDVSYNVLTYLPTNIGYELVNLEKLYVHLNKLRYLPSSIGEMRSLHILDAHFNELRGLPYSIGKLANLECLYLSSNFSDMTELPSSIGDLHNLKELDLSNNQIHTLPDSFGRLDNIVKLNLDQNPLEMPPPEIVNEGVESVKEYMAKRWIDLLLEEEQKSSQQEILQSQTGWLTRSTSWLGSWVSDVSGSVSEYLGTRSKSFKDPCLDQQY